jgi:hypothetical protein
MDTVSVSEDFLDEQDKLGDHVYLVEYPQMREALYILESYDENTGYYTARKVVFH